MTPVAREHAGPDVVARQRAVVSQTPAASSPVTGFRRYGWWVLAVTVAVIVWGAFVRATGSGAGCGEHWPLCNGEVVPRAPATETLIELTHRLTSGLSLLLVVALGWRAFRLFPRGHRVRWAAAASVVFIGAEALIGAGLVLLGLVADNQSSTRAVVLGVHLTNTFLLLGALALTVQFAARPSRTPARWQWGGTASAALAALLGCLVIGVSGAIAALGDTLFPVDSLTDGLQQDLSTTSHVLVRLRLHHPWIAVLVSAGMCGFALRMRHRFAAALGYLPGLMVGAVGAQLAIGLLNVVLLAPVSIQLLHLAGADVLWIVLVLLIATSLDAEARGG